MRSTVAKVIAALMFACALLGFAGVFQVRVANAQQGVNDVAVTDVTAERAWVYQGFSVSINVTVWDKGDFDETVTVDLYYNITANKLIGTQDVSLSPTENRTITFVWGTTGVPYCHNYTITANATIPEIDNTPSDNSLDGGPVKVRIPGDVDGGGSVNILDAVTFGNYFGMKEGDEGWNPAADLNDDDQANILDAIVITKYFGTTCPP